MIFILLLCLTFYLCGDYEIYDLEIEAADCCIYCVEEFDKQVALQSLYLDTKNTFKVIATDSLFSAEHYARGYELFNGK